MPTAPLRPCASPRCAALAPAGAHWCPAHVPAARATAAREESAYDARRGSAASRGYGHRWRTERATFLAQRAHRCAGFRLPYACPAPATVVDHVIPHRGDDLLFWDARNWQPLCKPCHDRKTATEDGGFRGAPRRPAAARPAPCLGLA